MQEFILIDERRYPLSVTMVGLDMLPYYRWEHRATIGYGTREFLAIVDALKGVGYLEEIVGGHLEEIKDSRLYDSLYRFAKEKELFAVIQPIMKPQVGRYI